MLFKNILLAAGIVGAASAQSNAADPQATTSMANMAGPSGTMMSMGAKSSHKSHSHVPVPSDLSSGFKTDQVSLKVHWHHGKKGGKKGKKGMSSMSMNGAATETHSSAMPSGTDGKKKGKKGKKHHHHKLNMKSKFLRQSLNSKY